MGAKELVNEKGGIMKKTKSRSNRSRSNRRGGVKFLTTPPLRSLDLLINMAKAMFLQFLVPMLCVGMLSGCGSSVGGSGSLSVGSSTITGTASKGPISNGAVKVYGLNSDGTTGSLLGSTTTSSDGSYSVNIGAYTGNIIAELTGGTYKDEATGNTVANTATLRAAVSDVTSSISAAITPLTEIAVQKAGTLTKDNINTANTVVSNMIGGVNILTTMPANVTDSSSASAATGAKDYGIILAAISQMIKDNPDAYGNVSQALSAIANDLSDNTLDSRGSNLSDALSSFISSSNNQSGVTSASTELDNGITNYITTAISTTATGSTTASESWNEISPKTSPSPMYGHTMAEVNDKVYLFGGDGSTTVSSTNLSAGKSIRAPGSEVAFNDLWDYNKDNSE